MSSIEFETPENVSVEFAPAGLGTRFLAWFLDQLLVWIITFLLIVVLIIAAVSLAGLEEFATDLEEGESDAQLYLIGFMMLVWGLGSFLYFGTCELLMRGQTPGKRVVGIRVVKADGFSLNAPSIVVRNIFRVVDHIPAMWIVPVLSARGQRAGDMVAGTVVICDEQRQLSGVRAELVERSALESQFRFSKSALDKLEERDVHGMELLLERWTALAEPQRQELVTAMSEPLARKMSMELPAPEQRLRFLEDLLAAELRRQQRGLG